MIKTILAFIVLAIAITWTCATLMHIVNKTVATDKQLQIGFTVMGVLWSIYFTFLI